jgi:hypothetical protein
MQTVVSKGASKMNLLGGYLDVIAPTNPHLTAPFSSYIPTPIPSFASITILGSSKTAVAVFRLSMLLPLPFISALILGLVTLIVSSIFSNILSVPSWCLGSFLPIFQCSLRPADLTASITFSFSSILRSILFSPIQ